mmetsp:Transcript_8804/g.11700  ORF Transcript_8804/g.11700 Transcript_8804/m.11700 type:complete len:136 (+) Transcript_8804:76-483(+)
MNQSPTRTNMPSKPLPLLFFGALFCLTAGGIASTCYQYPLFPFQTEDLDWSVAWLWATIVDFYGSTLCLSGIVLASEDTWLSGILWVAGFCLLGSPVCCVWVLLRLARTGSLRMEQQPLITRPESITGSESQRLS